MAFRARQAERENLHLKEDKPISKLVSNVRPALGDLGNKIHINQTQNGAKRKEVKAHPPGVIQKTVIGAIKKPATVEIKKSTNVEIKVHQTKEDSVKTRITAKEITNCGKNVNQNKDTHKFESLPSIEEPFSYSSKQLVGVINIDTSDNPLHVSEYVQDIYHYLLELENQYCIKSNFLLGHKTTPRMRAVLVNWMVDIQQSLKTLLETLHLSVALVDRYLQLNKKVGRENLQLVGTTALWIASKYEEIYPSDLTEFVYMCDNAFTKKQFLEMEHEILKKLDFELGRPLSLQFLRRYSRIAGVNADHHSLGKYLIELALMEYELCHIKPSLLAAAACCLSVTLLNNLTDPLQAWSSTLIYYSNYKYREIKPVVSLLACALKGVETSKYKSIYTKYSQTVHSKISLNPVLKSFIVSKLATQTPNTNGK